MSKDNPIALLKKWAEENYEDLNGEFSITDSEGEQKA